MRVVEIETQDGQCRYVVIDEAGVLVEPIVRYLKYLDHIGSARQTLRSYVVNKAKSGQVLRPRVIN